MPTYSYDPRQVTFRDRARFYVGDTDMSAPLLSDEEYDAQLTGAVFNIALANILEALANKVSSMPDEYDESGRVRVSWRNRGQAWLANAARLRGDPGEADIIIRPSADGVAIGEIRMDTAGYRPHSNRGRLPWSPWRG